MKKTVTISLDPISVVVNGENDAELLANAKKAIIEQLQTKFPSCTYSIYDEGTLDLKTVYPGQIVSDDNGDLGIVTAVNKKTINVTLTGHRDIQGVPNLFKASDATFEEARSKRNSILLENALNGDVSNINIGWFEGDTGYLTVKGEKKEVVVSKKFGNKYRVFIVNGNGAYYSLTPEQMETLLKDEA